MGKPLKEIIIKPNMVIKLGENESHEMITFIKGNDYIIGVHTDKGRRQRCVRVKEGEDVATFINGEVISKNSVEAVIDYNLPSDSCIVFERVRMTIEEIENALGLDNGSLEIKQ